MKRTYETTKMWAQLRADNRTIVNKEEYNALCDLRDGAHEALKLKMLKLQNNYTEVLAVNTEQLNRLTRMVLEVEHLKAHLARTEERERFIAARATKLEGETAKMSKIELENAALKAENAQLKARIESSYPARFTVPQPALGGGK